MNLKEEREREMGQLRNCYAREKENIQLRFEVQLKQLYWEWKTTKRPCRCHRCWEQARGGQRCWKQEKLTKEGEEKEREKEKEENAE